ncbi:hypothetical protein C5Y96_06900 [Blastopirellula marina]|uniref:Carboxypeptidase regulatory-like domain-containing protein n=1 Tax=Blastopirellula marina TaxID=124 RepID=A0A2S8FXI8_9BACT|nr:MULTISPECIES: hypothetical protein [Pirellulaceae]PQO36885.1 hypothetical protein C5Y96_06900 [Blastopirellula marina]RCS53600.1 hypothetical protein DTL36_06910 [Bremerella cremea]
MIDRGLQLMTRNPVEASVVLALGMALTLMLCSGCGGSVGEITGRVTLDGRPLDGAMITFKPVGNPEAKEFSTEVNRGSFTIASGRIAPGDYYVMLESQQPGAGAMIEGVQRGEGIPPPSAFVPKIYEKKGALRAKISANGENYLTFQLTSGGY